MPRRNRHHPTPAEHPAPLKPTQRQPRRKDPTIAERAPIRDALADRLMTRTEIADLLGCSQRQVFRLEDNGVLPEAVRVGSRKRAHWKSVVLAAMGKTPAA